jgi:hypothetical protein
LRTKNCRFNRSPVANAVHPSEHLNQPMLHLVDFRDR